MCFEAINDRNEAINDRLRSDSEYRARFKELMREHGNPYPDCCRNREIRFYPDQAGSRLRESPSFPRKRESRDFRD